jgi:hypothetical protein
MTSDLLHRIRWGNVARVAAVLLALALAVLWPRLRSPDTPLPPAAATPALDARVGTTAVAPPAETTAPVPRRAATHRPQAHRRPPAERRAHRVPSRPARLRVASSATVAAPAPAPATPVRTPPSVPPPAPPGAEFRP